MPEPDMARRSEPGIQGKSERWYELANGMWELRQNTRDVDDVLRSLKATEPTKAECRRRIREEVEKRKDLNYLAARVRTRKPPVTQKADNWIGPDHSFLEAADIWLAVRVERQRKMNPTSKAQYATYVDNTIRNRGSIGSVAIRDLTTPLLNHHAFQMAEGELPLRTYVENVDSTTGEVIGVREVLKSVGRKVPTTADKFRDIASLILDLAISHGAITANPARTMDQIDLEVGAGVVVPELEMLDRMRDALEAWWTRGQPLPGKSGRPRDPQRSVIAFWEILCATGMRPGEVLALRPQDCVPHEPGKLVLQVRGTVVTVSGRGTYRQDWPKSDSSIRDLVIEEPFIGEVVRMLMENGHTGLLFPSSKGRPMPLQTMARRMRQAIAESDMDSISSRGVRKIMATYLGTTEAAQAQLGHSDSRITLGHYRKRPIPLVDNAEEIRTFASRGADEPREITTERVKENDHWWIDYSRRH